VFTFTSGLPSISPFKNSAIIAAVNSIVFLFGYRHSLG
jgi:hypothetical protein